MKARNYGKIIQIGSLGSRVREGVKIISLLHAKNSIS
jgi:hypothetical protein